MRKLLGLSLLIAFLSGCSAEPALTQDYCLEQGLFRYEGECVDYYDIPEYDQEEVWLEIADEIAESRGITREEALMEMLAIIEYYAD